MDLTKREKIGLSIFAVIILVITSVMYFYKDKSETVEVISKNSTEASKGYTSEDQKSNKAITVDICGEVKKPGVYTLRDGDRVEKLISFAGGITDNADTTNINLAMKLKDEDFIKIPAKLQVSINSTRGEASADTQAGNLASQTGPAALININTGTKEQLKELPRIGDALAQRIIDYRENSGFFKDIKDITNVSGIGPKMFENIKDKITVH